MRTAKWLLSGLCALALAGCAAESGGVDGEDDLLGAGIELGGPGDVLFDPFVLPGDVLPWAPHPGVETPVARWCEDKAATPADACRLCENRSDECLDSCAFGPRDGAPDPVAVGTCVDASCGGCVRAGKPACEDARVVCVECGVCNRLEDARPVEDPAVVCELLWEACDADCALTGGGAACTMCHVRVTTECGPRG